MNILNCSFDTGKILFIEDLFNSNIKINNSYKRLSYINNLKNYYDKTRHKSFDIKNHMGRNQDTIDVAGCMSQGFCKNNFDSIVPDNLQEYTNTNFSDSTSCNQIGDLHKIKEQHVNHSVGDNNYKPASPPEGANYVSK